MKFRFLWMKILSVVHFTQNKEKYCYKVFRVRK